MVVILQISLIGSVSAKYFRYLPESDVVLDECYEEAYNAEGLQIFFANNNEFFCFYFNSTSPLIGIDVDNVFFFNPESPLDIKYAVNFSGNMAELILGRTLDFTNDNNFKFVISRYINETTMKLNVELDVHPRTPTQAYEVESDMREFTNNVYMALFGSWYSGIFWGFLVIAAWRKYLKPLFFTSRSTGDRRSQETTPFGTFISCEQSTHMKGMYLFRFKQGTKIGEYYCRENYETLHEQVAFSRFALYWHFYPDLIPVKLPLPENVRWKKTVIKISPYNKFVRVLQIICAFIPSTHLSIAINKMFEREETKEFVTEVDCLIVEFMEDRLTTVFTAEYEIYQLNPAKQTMDWNKMVEINVNYSQIEDLRRRIEEKNPREGSIRKLDTRNEHKALEHYINLRDAIKDRVSRVEMKVIYETKMLALERKLEDTIKDLLQTEEKYNNLQQNYYIDLKKAMNDVRSKLDFNELDLPKIVGEALGLKMSGVAGEKALSNVLNKHLDSIAEQDKQFFEQQLKAKTNLLENAMKRIQYLESQITKKTTGDLTVNDLESLAGGNHGTESK